MVIRIDTGAKSMELVEPDNTNELHVEVVGSADPADLDEVIAAHGAGRLVGDNAFIMVDKLRDWADGRTSDGWDTKFQMMLNKAGEKGWMNDDRTYVMAHIKTA